MGFEVKILADSVGPSGSRLTTFEATYPRIIHSEVLTHKILSRCSASSRAIPVSKLIDRVMSDPFVPEHIGRNQKGMQASEQLSEDDRALAVQLWLDARDEAVGYARKLDELKVHKQVVNRLIEPWMWITVIISGTEWDNFEALRCHEAAEPHFQKVAYMMRDMKAASKPIALSAGQWHLPLVHPEDVDVLRQRFHDERGFHPHADVSYQPEGISLGGLDVAWFYERLVKISVGRCARVSYLTHKGVRDISEDLRLHDDLLAKRPLHASPAEHVAQATLDKVWSGNFFGWTQYRKTLAFERVGRAP